MSSLKIEGKVREIFPEETITASLCKREFIVETNEEYPQLIKFELLNAGCSKIEPFKVGGGVTVFFNLKGREWNGKYFTNLHAWKIEGAVDAHTPPTTDSPSSSAKADPFDDFLNF